MNMMSLCSSDALATLSSTMMSTKSKISSLSAKLSSLKNATAVAENKSRLEAKESEVLMVTLRSVDRECDATVNKVKAMARKVEGIRAGDAAAIPPITTQHGHDHNHNNCVKRRHLEIEETERAWREGVEKSKERKEKVSCELVALFSLPKQNKTKTPSNKTTTTPSPLFVPLSERSRYPAKIAQIAKLTSFFESSEGASLESDSLSSQVQEHSKAVVEARAKMGKYSGDLEEIRKSREDAEASKIKGNDERDKIDALEKELQGRIDSNAKVYEDEMKDYREKLRTLEVQLKAVDEELEDAKGKMGAIEAGDVLGKKLEEAQERLETAKRAKVSEEVRAKKLKRELGVKEKAWEKERKEREKIDKMAVTDRKRVPQVKKKEKMLDGLKHEKAQLEEELLQLQEGTDTAKAIQAFKAKSSAALAKTLVMNKEAMALMNERRVVETDASGVRRRADEEFWDIVSEGKDFFSCKGVT